MHDVPAEADAMLPEPHAINASELLPGANVVFMTIDTLRYDVAVDALGQGMTPNLAKLLPGSAWQKRHSPGSFTYAAHQAFFAGFLPTPAQPGVHTRLWATRFEGSTTTSDTTFTVDAPDIVSGLAAHGYHTICIGGVGFFNKQTPLSCVLPDLFAESWWSPDLGVTCLESARNQVSLAVERLRSIPARQPVFLFINFSACHQPNRFYLHGAVDDSVDSQQAALAYIDSQLPPLLEALRARGTWLAVVTSDHGTAYGEDGYSGHRLAHSIVWTVPYMEFVINGGASRTAGGQA